MKKPDWLKPNVRVQLTQDVKNGFGATVSSGTKGRVTTLEFSPGHALVHFATGQTASVAYELLRQV